MYVFDLRAPFTMAAFLEEIYGSFKSSDMFQ